ncbi:hypothetical protein Tco_0058146 [Tanacetum coccineum]
MGSSPLWNTRTISPESGWENSECVDEIDKETVSFDEMQLKLEDRSASDELHLHVVHVVLSEHESDQHW